MRLDTRAHRFFWAVTGRPWLWIATSTLIIVGAGSFLPRLTKDTRSEAFIPPDHPSVLYREQVEQIFGLADPMVLAVVNSGPHGVFTPQSLELVDWLTDAVAQVEGIDPERITSLATESDIIGTEDGLLVEPFFESPPTTQAGADAVRTAHRIEVRNHKTGHATVFIFGDIDYAAGVADHVFTERSLKRGG